MFERIGYATFGNATALTLMIIKSVTGFDFKRRGIESRTLYFQALGETFGARPPDTRSATLKDQSLVEAFASIVFRSIGCKSLAEPLQPSGPQYMLAPEFTPISLHVAIFFKTMPQAYYDTFKNMLREAPGHFDEEFEYD
jgi:hypothetical protein